VNFSRAAGHAPSGRAADLIRRIGLACVSSGVEVLTSAARNYLLTCITLWAACLIPIGIKINFVKSKVEFLKCWSTSMDYSPCGLQICGNIINQQTLPRFFSYRTWLLDCLSEVLWWGILWRTRRRRKYQPARIQDSMIWKTYRGSSTIKKVYNAFIIFRFLPLNTSKDNSSWISLLSK